MIDGSKNSFSQLHDHLIDHLVLFETAARHVLTGRQEELDIAGKCVLAGSLAIFDWDVFSQGISVRFRVQGQSDWVYLASRISFEVVKYGTTGLIGSEA